MTKKQQKFSDKFVKELGRFVKEQISTAEKQGITKKEYQAIISSTFNLLGVNAEEFKREAGIK